MTVPNGLLSDPNCSLQNVYTLHFPKMQQVDENPAFGQLVTVAPVHIDHPHIARPIWRRHPHETASGCGCGCECECECEVWPTEEPTEMTLGDPAYMVVEGPVFETCPKGAGRCCQTNSNWSRFPFRCRDLCRTKLSPFVRERRLSCVCNCLWR